MDRLTLHLNCHKIIVLDSAELKQEHCLQLNRQMFSWKRTLPLFTSFISHTGNMFNHTSSHRKWYLWFRLDTHYCQPAPPMTTPEAMKAALWTFCHLFFFGCWSKLKTAATERGTIRRHSNLKLTADCRASHLIKSYALWALQQEFKSTVSVACHRA